jgi:hypothetical protein
VVVVDVVVVDVVVDVLVVLGDVDEVVASAATFAFPGEAPPPLKRTAEPETTAIAPTRPVPTSTLRTLTDRIDTPAIASCTAGRSARSDARLRKSHAG